MVIYIDSSQIDRVWFYVNPDATLYPPFYLSENELVFENFQWLDNYRPKTKNDIFIWEPNNSNNGKDKGYINNQTKADKTKKIKLEDIGKDEIKTDKKKNTKESGTKKSNDTPNKTTIKSKENIK